MAAQALPSGQGLGQGLGVPLEAGGEEGLEMPSGKAVYWLPEGLKVVS